MTSPSLKKVAPLHLSSTYYVFLLHLWHVIYYSDFSNRCYYLNTNFWEPTNFLDFIAFIAEMTSALDTHCFGPSITLPLVTWFHSFFSFNITSISSFLICTLSFSMKPSRPFSLLYMDHIQQSFLHVSCTSYTGRSCSVSTQFLISYAASCFMTIATVFFTCV